MGTITGSSMAEIDAPLDHVWAIVEDVLDAPAWQGGLKAMHELDRDAKVRTIKSTVRFAYDAPSRLRWRQEQGELKSVEGEWDLEDLGGDRTRATYRLDVELGRMLGMVIRGPLIDVLRSQLVGARAAELKRRAESA
jgi:hypothetical protein